MALTIKLAAAGLLLATASLGAQAAPPPAADLTVLASRGQLFTLVLDGRLLTGAATQQVHASWLAPGQHLADMQVFSPYGPPISFRAVVWLQPGLDSRYGLTTSPYGPALQALGAVVPGGYAGQGGYGGPVGRPGYGTPGGYGGAPYPGYPQGNAYPTPAPQPGGYAAPAPAPYGSEPAAPNGNGYPAPGNYGQSSPSPYPAPQGSYPPSQSYPQDEAYPDTAASPGELSPLPPGTLRDLAQELREQPTDQARLDVARQALEGSSLQAAELTELLRTLATEPARVELAELGYAHLSDPASFGQVYALLRPASVAQVQRDLRLQRAY